MKTSLALFVAVVGFVWAAPPIQPQENGAPSSAPPIIASTPSAAATTEARDFRQPVRDAVVGSKIRSSRAFLGAPPPVTHSLRAERSSAYCLECHALEERIEKRHHAIAPVPHAEFSQCLQCHVKANPTVTPFAESEFLGLDFPGLGSRAHEFAPPTVPHKTFLRENCLSCHGPTGYARIRTKHPERSQCLQCHVPEASNNYDRPVDWKALGGAL